MITDLSVSSLMRVDKMQWFLGLTENIVILPQYEDNARTRNMLFEQ